MGSQRARYNLTTKQQQPKKTIKTLIDAEYDRCLNQDSLYNTSHIVVDVNILPLFKND